MAHFVMARHLEHGTKNPIVARLTLQSLDILEQCELLKEKRDKIGSVYMNSLVKELMRCWRSNSAILVC
jgi:hypothetical protein